MKNVILSICIPSYNRPSELLELLESIDCKPELIEIVIAEDKSPKRSEIQKVVELFKAKTKYAVNYHQNEHNLGYDGNIRNLISLSQGHFALFMGDDDLFVSKSLDKYLAFLKNNLSYAYILRSYIVRHENNKIEYFRYLPESKEINAGEESVAWLFKRSVTICGFTINREEALKVATKDVDGTLLYQIYLMAEVCLKNKSIYCDFPVAQAIQTYRLDKPMFGASAAEKGKYTPGTISIDNSINFTKAYFELTKYLDNKHRTNITQRVLIDLSKYSYPFLSIQRKRGLFKFLTYVKRLKNEVGFGITPYFYAYSFALALFGERFCDRGIVLVKRFVGHTPNF